MMSRQLTWYSNLTSEEGTVTTRDVEPFVVCSDKVQFIDPSYEVDLLPEYEKLSCHQKDKTKSPHKDKTLKQQDRFKHSQPYTRKLWINPITAGDKEAEPKGIPQQE
jgi:hypothetical protein